MMFKWKVLAAAIVGAGIVGFGTGAWVVYKLWEVDQLTAINTKLVKDTKRLKEAIGLGEKIDDENTAIELSNEEVQNALRRKIAQSQSSDYECVSADSMLAIRSLR
ncbi:MAG: hypothetical protein AB7Q00_14430 [Phycisphaerales bacterium]